MNRILFLPFACSSLFAMTAFAQQPPFNGGGGGVAYDPEISVLNTGALLDAQVVVSADERYVTINARPSASSLGGLFTFPVAGFTNVGAARQGYVGGAGFIDDKLNDIPADVPKPAESKATAEGRAHATRPGPVPKNPTSASPAQILKADPTATNSVLRKEGMFLLTPANATAAR